MRNPYLLQEDESVRSKSHWTFDFHFCDLFDLPDVTIERFGQKGIIPIRTIQHYSKPKSFRRYFVEQSTQNDLSSP